MSVVNEIRTILDDDFMDLSSTWDDHLADGVEPSAYFRLKDAIDRLLGTMLLAISSPLIGLLILLVRLTSRGPGIYRQPRVGKNGDLFTMYKIRTMIHAAESRTGPVWTKTNDDRITLIGRALRKLHLDEFPQLLNVAKGEMSLIGPRPERPEFVCVLAKEIPGYLNRLSVRPGVTGLAQVNLEPDTDLDSVRRKLALDLEYIEHAGLLFDFRMFLCTFVHLLGFSGDWATDVMGLRRMADSRDADSPLGQATPATPVGPEDVAGSVLNRPSRSNGRSRHRGNHEGEASRKPR